jgi:predicted trehalose synthase
LLHILNYVRAQLETLSTEVSEIRTELGNTAIVINDTAEHVKTLVDIAPAIADQVQELSKNVPGLLGRIQEDLKVCFIPENFLN